jgi:hypothetical protein
MRRDTIGLVGQPVAALCSSGFDIGRLVELSKELPAHGDVVLLLAPKPGIEKRLLPAFANATVRVRGKVSRSRSLQMEMLLFVCGTMNIGAALASCGAKSEKGFVVFASSRKLFAAFSKEAGLSVKKRIELKLDFGEAGSVAATELDAR